MKRIKNLTLLVVVLITSVSCLENELPDIQVLSFDDQLAVDIEKIDDYLEENNITALVHESGIRYVMETEGTGVSPMQSDIINVTYEGTLLTGEVFDSNSAGFQHQLSGLIRAWQMMLPLMKEGGRMTIYTPSGYAYGTDIVGDIPPNSPLIFDIELVDVVD